MCRFAANVSRLLLIGRLHDSTTKVMTAELTDSTNEAEAYAIMGEANLGPAKEC